MEVRRFTQTPANRENPGVLRTPGRAGPRGHPVRERWLNAWPANAPLRSRLGWGVTFVHFYVAHPEPGLCSAQPIAINTLGVNHAPFIRGFRGSLRSGVAVRRATVRTPGQHGRQWRRRKRAEVGR